MVTNAALRDAVARCEGGASRFLAGLNRSTRTLAKRATPCASSRLLLHPTCLGPLRRHVNRALSPRCAPALDRAPPTCAASAADDAATHDQWRNCSCDWSPADGSSSSGERSELRRSDRQGTGHRRRQEGRAARHPVGQAVVGPCGTQFRGAAVRNRRDAGSKT